MRPLAVIDVETTGLNPFRHDRVVEVAVALVVPGQGILAELTTLVNPERDIGPTSVHGIAASDVLSAPRFADIAAHLSDILDRSIALVGHNVRFDAAFLQSEYARISVEMPSYPMIDTMVLAGGGTLHACCQEQGIEFGGDTHSAMHDVRATAHLLQKLPMKHPGIVDLDDSSDPPVWPLVQVPHGTLLPRDKAANVARPMPTYLQRLAERLSVGSVNESRSGQEQDYRSLLWRVLEDRRIEDSEGDSLVEVAMRWGLSHSQVMAIHADYLLQLAKAAWADHCITSSERREIQMVAHLLGLGTLSDEQLRTVFLTSEHSVGSMMPSTGYEDLAGKSVCFTGECNCTIDGQIISRATAISIAASRGLRILPTVRKDLDLLVVGDPNTQSGKATKARHYGVRVVHEPVFWRMLGVEVD